MKFKGFSFIIIHTIACLLFACQTDNGGSHNRQVVAPSQTEKISREDIEGRWIIEKVILREVGVDPRNRTARSNVICELLPTAIDRDFAIEFLPNSKLIICDSIQGSWKINEKKALVLSGDVYQKNFPILVDTPLEFGEDQYYTYLYAHFGSGKTKLGHKFIYCLSKVP